MAHLPVLEIDEEKLEQKRMWHHRISKLFARDHHSHSPWSDDPKQEREETAKSDAGRRLSKRVVPILPRPGTFRRQNSERRERLTPVPASDDRRTLSVDRRRTTSARPTLRTPVSAPKVTGPASCSVDGTCLSNGLNGNEEPCADLAQSSQQADGQAPVPQPELPPPPTGDAPSSDSPPALTEASYHGTLDEDLQVELEGRWILNLSMHFRDKSPREKFFVTYAQAPTRWRRVTVSVDYREAPLKSLERDLQNLQYQSHKSSRIYEAIRNSLPDIQFFDTVTNLKLATDREERLHVHVSEDANEIIPYPSIDTVQHLGLDKRELVPESEVVFLSHMSGFVYKVRVNGRVYVKKEIPGPDSVEEFLYEINALHSLVGAANVIQFRGLIVDDKHQRVKGLLIDYAEQGPLIDMIFDYGGRLSWRRRERWARQIVHGLSEIHEAGFVQGDFTLSNVCIDGDDVAHIIDINRRGCPVGWEPPEIGRMIESGQRISMFIGVKSDLFQLGMVLWALAEEVDEPERQPRPLSLDDPSQPTPDWYIQMTNVCLSQNPRDRLPAYDHLSRWGRSAPIDVRGLGRPVLPTPRPRDRPALAETRKDPDTAVADRTDRTRRSRSRRSRRSSLDIPFDDSNSCLVPRGRAPATNTSHLFRSFGSRSPFGGAGPVPVVEGNDEPQIVSVSPSDEHRWTKIEVDGRSYIVRRDSTDLGVRDDGVDNGQEIARRTALLPALETESAQGRRFVHADSGLADMGIRDSSDEERGTSHASNRPHTLHMLCGADSGLADMDLAELAGVGGNEAFLGYKPQSGRRIFDLSPERHLESGSAVQKEGEEPAGAQEVDGPMKQLEVDDTLPGEVVSKIPDGQPPSNGSTDPRETRLSALVAEIATNACASTIPKCKRIND